jgi:hypothetical protein
VSTLGKISGYSEGFVALLDCWLLIDIGETRGDILSLFIAGENGSVGTGSLRLVSWT